MRDQRIKVSSNAVKLVTILLLIPFCLVLTGFSPQSEIERLIQRLKDKNWRVRKEAVEALGEIEDPRAVTPLISVLVGKIDSLIPLNELIKKAGVDIGSLEDQGLITAIPSDKNTDVRRAAAEALGKIKDPRAVGPLLSAFKDEHPVVHREAADALGKIGEPAFEPLLSALKDEDWHVRRGAAEALGEIKDPRAVEPLLSALKDEDLAVVAGAYRFFIERGEPDTEAVLTKALDKYGNKTMAEVFLNCGNAQLATAARKWASSHGYTIMSFPGGSGGPKWGSKR
jgi:HEAT repeat protein